MEGFRVPGPRKRLLLTRLNEVANKKVKEGVNVNAFINKMYNCSTKTLHQKLTTKQLSGVISAVKDLQEIKMITKIAYGITRNLGDYNSERIDAEYQVAEGENPNAAMVKLKTFVKTGAMQVESEPERQITSGPNPTEEKVTEDIERGSAPTERITKEEKEEVKKKATKKASKKTTKKAAKKDEPIKYDREQKDHKKKMAAVLNEHFPTWKKDAELGALAKGLSEKLVGVPIFDKKGNLLDSFVEAVKDGMATDDDGLQ